MVGKAAGMTGTELIAFPLIALAAFYLKGITGTGTSTVVVSCASFLIDPKLAVVLAAFMNVFGGFAMIKFDHGTLKPGYWVPVAAAMVLGSLLGAWALKAIDPEIFKLVLGCAFLLCSAWMLVGKPPTTGVSISPDRSTDIDFGVGTFAGFCGGFIGINAPILILHYGRYLDKRLLRRLLILIFIPAAVVQTVSYAFNGLLSVQVALYGLWMLPFMAIGIYLGNHSFHRVSESAFRRILAVFLILVSAKLIYSGIV